MEFTPEPEGGAFSDLVRVMPQYPLPTHALSRVVHAATRSRTPWFKDFLINRFMHRFRVDLGEALEPDARRYASFNAFFTRALREGVRSVTTEPGALACPVDGIVYQAGRIDGTRIFQAKGQDFSLVELLGGKPSEAAPFHDGAFATMYLAPHDYHRIHLPLDGVLKSMTHVPGRLFSVNPPTVRRMPRVFARNERIVCRFDTEAGPLAVVLVGALFVGSIETVWAGEVTPPGGHDVRRWTYDGDTARPFLRGDEIGRFNMGSTVILLFGRDRVQWHERLRAQTRVRMGERIGMIR